MLEHAGAVAHQHAPVKETELMSTIILSPPPIRSKLRPGRTRGEVVPQRGPHTDHLLELAP